MKSKIISTIILLACYSYLFSQKTPISFKIDDKRFSQNYSIPYTNIHQYIVKELNDRNFVLVENYNPTSSFKPILLTINIDYLNYYESGAGNLFGKGIINIKLKNPNTVDLNHEFNVTVDIPINKIKLKHYANPKYSDQFSSLNKSVQDKLFERLLSKMEPFIENYYYYAEDESVDPNAGSGKSDINEKVSASMVSDVDIGIPKTDKVFENRYALIIGNEDYTKFQTDLNSEVNVEFANRDATTFATYCENVLGIPKKNIVLLVDAISSQMKREIEKLAKLSDYSNGQAELIFYYAGHGFPDETTKESYIMPVDISGQDVRSGIKLSDLYEKLTEFPSKRVTVFLDACFSGGGRNQGLLAARGVKIKPKENKINGNIVIFSATSEDQSSLPYKEKGHGMFTYFLLKKLQETKGNVNYYELNEYIRNKVQLNSVKINSKDQNPNFILSPDVQSVWKEWQIN